MDRFTRTILRGAALPTLIVGVLVTVAVWLIAGSTAGLGALLGVVIVVPFFTIGQLVLGAVLKRNPAMGMTVAMMLYLVKIGALAILLIVLAETTWFDTKVFAVNILVCTLVWTAAEVYIFTTTKVLVVDPENVPEAVRQQSQSD